MAEIRVTICAAIATNGVIGRSTKPCETCDGRGRHTVPFRCDMDDYPCKSCGGTRVDGHAIFGTGRVPCKTQFIVPTYYPEYTEHLDKLTDGHAVVMDRIGWDAIGPKTQRANVVVLSKDAPKHPEGPSIYTASSLPSAIAMARDYEESHLFVIGGPDLFAAALPLADDLELTMIRKDWDGDLKFPHWECFSRTEGLPIENMRHYGYKDGWMYECVSREVCATNTEIAFTKWVRTS